jgi:nucleotide-binding universal stress UspA family protein
MFKHILVPIDGSDCSLHALEIAAQFAREQQARLSVCTVVDPAKAAAMAFGEASMAAACLDALDEEGKALVEDAAARVHDIWAADVAVLDGAPVDTILDHQRETGADLIIIGSHGRTGLPRLFLGSVAEGVIRNAPVPVMVVRQLPLMTKSITEEAKATAQAVVKAPAAS